MFYRLITQEIPSYYIQWWVNRTSLTNFRVVQILFSQSCIAASLWYTICKGQLQSAPEYIDNKSLAKNFGTFWYRLMNIYTHNPTGVQSPPHRAHPLWALTKQPPTHSRSSRSIDRHRGDSVYALRHEAQGQPKCLQRIELWHCLGMDCNKPGRFSGITTTQTNTGDTLYLYFALPNSEDTICRKHATIAQRFHRTSLTLYGISISTWCGVLVFGRESTNERIDYVNKHIPSIFMSQSLFISCRGGGAQGSV